MKYKILAVAFMLGILIGITIFSNSTVKEAVTGAAIENCYINNEKCECDEEKCVCGDKTVNSEYCSSTSS
ncbi:MAG TPA: hypothetical protein VI612_05010 [Candidatus Nanoarchaeia archaeon]|nr:hypothetical protein [Candidatus Nanoarchaeia archaeon]